MSRNTAQWSGFVIAAAVVSMGAFGWIRVAWISHRIELLQKPFLLSSPYIHRGAGAKAPLVMIGDSRVSQWPSDLLDPAVVNRGLAGETSSHLALRGGIELQDRRPDALLIASGINDLVAASFMSPAEADRVLEDVVDRLTALAENGARAHAQVYLATIIAPSDPGLVRLLFWSQSITAYVKRANQQIRSRRFGPGIQVVDFDAALNPGDAPYLPRVYRRDTLHLNREAYCRLTLVLPAVFRRKDLPSDGGLQGQPDACQGETVAYP